MTGFLAVAVALLLGLFLPSPWPLPLPSLGLLLAPLAVLASPGWTGCLSLGLPGDQPPVEGGAP